MPIELEFLDWDEPFLEKVVAWLWARRGELTQMLVVLPTAQSGRRLRAGLLAQAQKEGRGGLLMPKIVTSSFILQVGEGVADRVQERVAWVDVLENVRDWSRFEEAFPLPPGEGENSGWSLGLAESMCQLRWALSEGGLTIAMAAARMADSVESERWSALAGLEKLVEARLRDWGLQSHSYAQVNGFFEMPQGLRQVVVAGVGDAGATLRGRLAALADKGVGVNILVAAPEELAEKFDAFGRPEIDFWSEKPLPTKSESVHLARNGREQARRALALVAESRVASNELALGSADQELGPELVDVFGQAGWVVFDSANSGRPLLLASWLQLWRTYLSDPRFSSLADLLEREETGILVKGKRAQKAQLLSDLRARWLLDEEADLARAIEHERRETKFAGELLAACESLNSWRADFLRGDFSEIFGRLLSILARVETVAGEVMEVREVLGNLSPLMKRVKQEATFWLEVIASALGERNEAAPENRVADVQGWLELLFEPGKTMVLCGMNEGLVPSRGVQDAWLVEATRERLGLPTEKEQAARDAWLLHAMLSAREADGRVDLICGKTRANGDVLQPSRLLLAVPLEELATRVTKLFAKIEPPESGQAWQRDWKWQVPDDAEVRERLNVTSIKNYLRCPFRFYLTNVVGMSQIERGLVEWDNRQFGNVAHELLELWGRDSVASDFSKTEAIFEWLEVELKKIVDGLFGENWPLAVEIQAASMRQRLQWFARVQACMRAEGWRVFEVEKKFAYEVDGRVLVGKVDRIDRHDDGRFRVIDYKTGKVSDGVEKMHCKSRKRSNAPAHLESDERLYFEGTKEEKMWVDLQLPLYATILEREGVIKGAVEIGYFGLGESEAGVRWESWKDYDGSIGEAAFECAQMVVERINAREFWPPAEKGGPYDSYAELILQGTLEDAVAWGQ